MSVRVCDESFWVDRRAGGWKVFERSPRCAIVYTFGNTYVRRKTGRCKIVEVGEECMYVYAKCHQLKIHGQWTEGYCEWRV